MRIREVPDRSLPVHIRWSHRSDMDQVMKIEEASFACPWTEKNFLGILRNRNVIMMVAEQDRHVLGYVVYELRREEIEIRNLAVDPARRREGVGERLIGKMLCKLATHRRRTLLVRVGEANLDAQLFLRFEGFRCVEVEPGYYRDGSTAYLFSYEIENPLEE
jgi:[ribosomal protein S18]-alanine N-acetyltransferase